MYSLRNFSLTRMTACGTALRKLGTGATSLEMVTNRIVTYFYEQFVDPETHASELALVRCFKTHPWQDLPADLQRFATAMVAAPLPQPEVKCLTLMATAGDQPDWRQRSTSGGHQAIPLLSEQMVAQVPMIAQLIQQLGLSISHVLTPSPDVLVDLQERTYNVFHIPQALGSPYIPAQEAFVMPYGIESVLGFGGMLPSGNLVTVILFSKVPIRRETAELFKPLALNVKMALLPFERTQVFDPAPLPR